MIVVDNSQKPLEYMQKSSNINYALFLPFCSNLSSHCVKESVVYQTISNSYDIHTNTHKHISRAVSRSMVIVGFIGKYSDHPSCVYVKTKFKDLKLLADNWAS